MEKIKLTEDMTARIKHMQKEMDLRNKEVASHLGISIDKYKNIIGNKNDKMESKYLPKLAELFKCTEDYLIGASNSPSYNRQGRKITHPVNFDIAKKQAADVSRYFETDYDTLNSIHLILCRIPTNIRKEILSTFNTICHYIPTTMLLDRRDELNKENLAYIINNIKYNNAELTKMTLKLTEAHSYLGKRRNRKAFNIYLEIIYHASDDSLKVATKAVTQIELLEENWSNFPKELKPLSSTLKTFVSYLYRGLPPETDHMIFKYLESQNIPIQNRTEYLKSLSNKY